MPASISCSKDVLFAFYSKLLSFRIMASIAVTIY